MRLVSKFALAFFMAACVCLALFGVLDANHEVDRLEKLATSGLLTLGAGLRPSIEEAWSTQGFAAADQVVAAFHPDSEIHAQLVEDLTGEGATEGVPRVQTSEAPGGRYLRVAIRVAGPDGRVGTLELARTIEDRRTVLRAELRDQLVAVLALAVVMAVIAGVLGVVLIGRPLARIVAQARRIGAGDFSMRLRATRGDEIGDLKRELNAMCDRLEDALERLDAEAAARVETLEQLRHLDRVRTVGTFAASIAHELGTPLNILLLRGQSLAGGELERSDVADAGQAVLSQVEKMSRIVRQLLDFTRVRSKSGRTIGDVDLLRVSRHSCALLALLAKKHGVTIRVEGSEGVVVRGDFGQLEQALTNLIVNGIQAMPEGGRLVVRVGTGDLPRSAIIEVTDEGTGMSEEIAARVFEPFFTTKYGAEGTGLGLNVSQGIAEDHGGSITVASELGKGSTFTLRLPQVA
jgi:signal transduction histidine kinase